jgi:CRISPR-associated protein Cas5t
MYNCMIEIAAQTASFRDPDFQNYHRSLGLPAPTNVIGMAGAALGLSPPDAQAFFDQHRIRIGIAGHYQAKAKDLWKYPNVKNFKDLHRYHPNLEGSSVIQREFLYNMRLYLGFSSANVEAIEQLSEGFLNPVFALSLGPSDSLAKVMGVVKDLPLESRQEVSQCYLEGDLMMEINSRLEDVFDFSISSVPSLHQLPTAFAYESPYGKRQVLRSKIFSHVPQEAKLNFAVEGIQAEHRFIPLLNL